MNYYNCARLDKVVFLIQVEPKADCAFCSRHSFAVVEIEKILPKGKL